MRKSPTGSPGPASSRNAYPVPRQMPPRLYERLILSLVENEDWFGLVWRDDGSFSRRAKGFWTGLKMLQIDRQRVHHWPGTRSAGLATVIRYETSRRALSSLLSVDSFFAWIKPDRPEDLFFGSGDSDLAYVSVTHEMDAWLLRRRYASLIAQEVTLTRETWSREDYAFFQGYLR